MERSLVFIFLLAFAVAHLATSSSSKPQSSIVKHSLHVKNLKVNHLCNEQVIVAANGTLPGPTISVREGDTLVVDVFNESPYNITIHWHGIFQMLSGWADGPEYVTQCPIRPRHSYTYKFRITGQEGTLWWHAHSSWLRATVHGALIIHPQKSFPFPQPDADIPILLGEWWNGNVVDIENAALAIGGAPNNSDAYTINGKPGNLYNCSQNDMFILDVEYGKTYLLRIINAALNNQLFFKIANHTMTVVAVDATYTTPYPTDIIITAPGQTVDVLLCADQPAAAYYMAASPYSSAVGVPFDNTTTRALLRYKNGAISTNPPMPALPAFNDTPTVHKFFTNLTSLPGAPHWVPVPHKIDEHMFVTFGLGLDRCSSTNISDATCAGPFGQRLAASMNNHSFVLPRNSVSMLEAFFSGIGGVYTLGFPDRPPIAFDYTNQSLSFVPSLLFVEKGTRVKRLKYGDVVEMVLQNTALIGIENHPLHLHGFNFHVMAQGFGNYDDRRDRRKFNFFNPQIRNTIGVPVGGWAVIRFKANNPGIWMMHCHLDVHLPWGLGMAFEVQNGPTPLSTLPPPPSDLPKC